MSYTFKKGDTVIMEGCYEATLPQYKGKIWTCTTDSYLDKAGQTVVFLEGFSGCFFCGYLKDARELAIQEYLPNGVTYDPSSGMVSAKDRHGKYVPVADIRGWSYLVKLFDENLIKASDFQDKLGHFIAESINYKLNKKGGINDVAQ